MTRVSVLLPVRNGMPYLPGAVDSILGQSFENFELIVIDDGSRDGTGQYLRGLTDPRVRVLSPGGVGLARALNLGIEAARGEFIARQDADDLSWPDRLERQVDVLDARPEVDVLATRASFVDADGHVVDSAWTRTVQRQWDAAVEPDQIARLMPLTCCIFHATIMARAQVLRDAGGYDQSMVPAEDYDLWLRLLPKHQFARVKERLYTVRIHADSSSARRRADQQARVIEAKLRYVRRQVPTLPRPVRLVLPCDDRGADLFRRIGPAEGFDPMMAACATGRATDVVAVTDFSAVSYYERALPAAHQVQQFGNLFVREAGI